MNDPAAAASLAAAMARHRSGDLAAARPLYRRHLQHAPQDAGAWCLLASLEGQCGDHRAAEQAFRKAIAADPAQAQGHAGLGTSLLLADDPASAIDALRRALELDPDLSDTRYQLAVAMHRCERRDEAAEVLEHVLDKHPGHLQARHNLGAICLERGDPQRAAACFRAVLAQDRRRVPAWAALARAQTAMDHPAEAEESLRQALALAPSDVSGRAALGRLLQSLGRLDEARQAYMAILERRRGDPAALAGLAELDLHGGDARGGMARLAPALANGLPALPVMVAAARLWLDLGEYATAAEQLSQWTADPRMTQRLSVNLRRLLGDALDRLGRHEQAWSEWSRANELSEGYFDPAQFATMLEMLRKAYREPRQPPSEWSGPTPVLTLGLPRSGKSVLEQMLSCHPDVHGGGELRVLGALTETLRERGGSGLPYPACVAELTPELTQSLTQTYSRALDERSAGARFLIDTQPTNFLHLGLAAAICPTLRVIYCRRQPLDLALACYARGFADAASTAFSRSVAGIGSYLAGVERLMDHWRGLGIDVLDVDFEDLVTDPEHQLRRALAFLGLEWTGICSGYGDPARASLSAPPILHGPMQADQIGRGEAYREQLHAVLDAAQRTGERG